MKTEEFNRLVEEQIRRCKNTLIHKATEYATDVDRLHNFKSAALLQNITTAQALGGMLAKHVISIFDLISGWPDNYDSVGLDVWNEKIGDAINYLLILRAMVEE